MLKRVGGRLAIVFVLAILLLITNAFISYRSIRTLIANNDLVNHTQDVLEDLQDLRASLVQIEADARGYLLTGDQEYLNSYRTGVQQTPEKVRALKTETADNPSHQEKFPRLEDAVRSRLELLDEYVQRREAFGTVVITAGRTAEGKRRMDELHAAVEEIARDERALLDLRIADSAESGRRTLLTFIIANIVIFALVSLVFYLAIRDIRERRENEERLSEARDHLEARVIERTAELGEANLELERSNRELQDFAFVASHDLQEPLRKIQAFGDRLRTTQGELLNDQGRDYLDRMHNAAGRMHTLINDLLAFSRVTTRAQPYEPTDLNRIVEDVLGDLETTIEQYAGTVRVGDLPTIEADALQMRQLFQNLITNALKFRKTEAPPEVVVNAEGFREDLLAGDETEPRDLVRITVADNGIGFDEKYLDRIFTPFQRLHGRNEYEGTGIGLAVCRKIVERHGGMLTATSTEGKGSTFIAVLPATQDKEK